MLHAFVAISHMIYAPRICSTISHMIYAPRICSNILKQQHNGLRSPRRIRHIRQRWNFRNAFSTSDEIPLLLYQLVSKFQH